MLSHQRVYYYLYVKENDQELVKPHFCCILNTKYIKDVNKVQFWEIKPAHNLTET